MRSVFWWASVALAAAAVRAQSNASCKVELLKGMSFDLTPLRRGEPSIDGVYVADAATMFSVNDTEGAGVGIDYVYDFNFCGAVEPSTPCQNKGYSAPRSAFQTATDNEGFCYPLSGLPALGWQFSAYGESFQVRNFPRLGSQHEKAYLARYWPPGAHHSRFNTALLARNHAQPDIAKPQGWLQTVLEAESAESGPLLSISCLKAGLRLPVVLVVAPSAIWCAP
jgi:hypothetical protein